MSKRILIIMTTPLTLDGISNMMLNYIRHFKKNQFVFDFVVWNDVRDDIRDEIEGFGGRVYKLPYRVQKPIQYFKRLKELMKEQHYSIVHAHGNSATLYIEMLAAKSLKIPTRIAHSHNSMCSHMLVHKTLQPFFVKSYTHAFACSKKAGDWLYNGKPYELINNGIELERFKFNPKVREEVRSTLNLNDNKIVGHVGNFDFAKNHDYMIDIFATLYRQDNRYRLLLVGEGMLMSKIREKIKKLGLNECVLMLGIRRDVPDILQAIDVFLMPSLHEGLPLVLIEAQAAGLPCVVSENITQEVNPTGMLRYLSLQKPPMDWADVIEGLSLEEREQQSVHACKDLEAAGFNITLEAEKLERRYSAMIKGDR